jgi:hypothetical protein
LLIYNFRYQPNLGVSNMEKSDYAKMCDKSVENNSFTIYLRDNKIVEGKLIVDGRGSASSSVIVYNKDKNRFYAVQLQNVLYMEIVADLNIEKDIKQFDDEVANYKKQKKNK